MKTIGVFFGGRSTEHDISIITAQLIIAGLKGLDYEVIPVYVDSNGHFLFGEDFGKIENFSDSKKDIVHDVSFRKYYLDLENSIGKLVFKKKGFGGKEIIVDLAFPAFHGSYGEDGTIQGFFEMLNVPYVGCDVTSSALAMDKALTKLFYQANGIPTTKFIYFTKNDWQKGKDEILGKLESLTLPLFVKPVHLGSSIGIAKITNSKDLVDKIEVAFYYDDIVLVEEGVNDLMDVTCCLIGNDDPVTSKLQESVYKADLFDFEEKYLNQGGGQTGRNKKSVIIPARLDEETTVKIQEMAKKIYLLFGCSGIARVDFLYDQKAKIIYANEINPLPGTLYHHLWKESGIELDELLKKLIVFAEERHERTQKINYKFNSSVLSNLDSNKLNVKLKIKDEK